MTKLYHFEVYLPPVVFSEHGKRYSLSYSFHARNACRNDRYGLIIPPTDVTIDKTQIVEAEVEGNSVRKLVVRTKYNDINDLILVICPLERGIATVKTVWINRRDDKHRTLDTTPYATE